MAVWGHFPAAVHGVVRSRLPWVHRAGWAQAALPLLHCVALSPNSSSLISRPSRVYIQTIFCKQVWQAGGGSARALMVVLRHMTEAVVCIWRHAGLFQA